MDVALNTRTGLVLIRDLVTVVDALIDVFFMRDDVLQKLGISPQHLLEQNVASGEVKDLASPYPKDSCLNETFNEDDDEVPIGETNDYEFLEALENMVLRASKGLGDTDSPKLLEEIVTFAGTHIGDGVLIVPKPKLPDEFRMTVDTRYPNSQLVAVAGCLPILEVLLQHLKRISICQLGSVQRVQAIHT
jgi:hypothetical protein